MVHIQDLSPPVASIYDKIKTYKTMILCSRAGVVEPAGRGRGGPAPVPHPRRPRLHQVQGARVGHDGGRRRQADFTHGHH